MRYDNICRLFYVRFSLVEPTDAAVQKNPERRKGVKDRRASTQERRNEDRVAEDPLPRRNVDEPERRGDA